MFFKKKLLVQACALVLLTPISSYVIAEICIGNNYEYDVVAPDNAIPPTLKIELPETMPSLSGGQSTSFKLTPTLATGETVADFFICAPQGELIATAPDQIKYTAPSQIQSDQVIKIVAQVAGSQGLVGGDNFYLQLKATTGTNACTDTRRKNNSKITICHKGKETKSIPESAWSGHQVHGDTLGACAVIDNSTGGTTDNTTTDTTNNTSITDLCEIPPPDAVLEDTSLLGTPEKPLEEVPERKVEGKVSFSYVIISKLIIGINAKVTFDIGVRFKKASDIPRGVNLSDVLPKIQQSVIRTKSVPAAIDLSQSIVINAKPILQQIQTNVSNIQQDQTTGNLTVDIGEQRFNVKPVKVTQGEGKKAKGFSVETTGNLTFVTEEDHEVEFVPVMEDVDQLSDTLEQGGIGGVETTDSGQITASLTEAPDQVSYAGAPEMFSTPVDDSTPVGLQSVDAEGLPAGNQRLRALIFKDKHGKKRKQKIYPYIAQLDFGQTFNIDLNGVVTFNFNETVYRGVLDYGIMLHSTNSNASFDIQPKGDGNYTIIYPSGKQQTFYPLK